MPEVIPMEMLGLMAVVIALIIVYHLDHPTGRHP